MADSKLSALASATLPVGNADLFYIVQGGVAKKVAFSDLGAGFQPIDTDLTDIGNIADVQGDIIIRGAAGWQRLAKSATATDVLTAGASQPLWAAPSGGGGGTAVGTTFDPSGTAFVSTNLQTLGEEIDDEIDARVALGILDARAGMQLAPLYIKAAADTAATVSDATLNDDPTLLLTAIPIGEYNMRMFVSYDSATAAQFMMGFTHTGTMTMDWSANGLISTAAALAGSIDRDLLAIGDPVTVGANGVGNSVTASPTGLLIVTAPGNLQFQWCQGISTASNTIRRARSFLLLNRVA